MEVITLLLKYAVAPLAVVVWYMLKKHDDRLDQLEKRTNNMEKVIAKIETEIHFIGRDIKEIKTILNRLIDKK